MSNFHEMSDIELADCLYEWVGDAANAWDRFNDSEKSFVRRLQDEVCKRFIQEHREDIE